MNVVGLDHKTESIPDQEVKVDRLLTMKDFTQITGFSSRWYHRNKEQLGIPGRKMGRNIRFIESELWQWIREFKR